MKEPWAVYADEFAREIKRKLPSGQNKIPLDLARTVVENAEQMAAEATAYHLVDEQHWEPDEAEALIEKLRAVSIEGAGSRWREGLRHAWTDWMLSRKRGPH